MNQNPNKDESKSLWHGRFLEQSADELQKLNNSISYDIRLFSQDIEGSRAHAKMLQRIGIFSENELSEVLSALDQVEEEIQDGSFSVLPSWQQWNLAGQKTPPCDGDPVNLLWMKAGVLGLYDHQTNHQGAANSPHHRRANPFLD